MRPRRPTTRPALKAFRAEREKILLADNGWFTVAGLHFLNPGENKFGSDPLNDIVLEFADVPKQAGVITMNGNTVTIKAADGQTLTYNGKPAKEEPLRLSGAGPARRSHHLQVDDVLPALQRPAPRDPRARSECAAAQELLRA